MLTAGRDLDQAMWRATELEALARQYQLATTFGGPVLLQAPDITAARNMFASYRPG
jgi:L-fuculose-phosphate aldolase